MAQDLIPTASKGLSAEQQQELDIGFRARRKGVEDHRKL